MADEPNSDEVFTPGSPPSREPERSRRAAQAAQPASRRAARAMREEGRGAPLRRPPRGRPRYPDDRPRRRRRLRGWIVGVLVVLIVLGAGGGAVWGLFGDRIVSAFASDTGDYSGTGDGTKVTVVIRSGDIGSDVAHALADHDVTKSYDVFYKLLLAHPDVQFEPGSYRLEKHMSAKAALAALRDPDNRVTARVVLPEGIAAPEALKRISAATGIKLADLQSAAADYASLGVPAQAPSIEGFLFPATYTFDPGTSAHDILQQMVSLMLQKLDAAGVAPEDRLHVVTMASIVQRESGPNTDDMYKIARVFYNRLADASFPYLQSDATVAYGTGHTDRVSTTQAERDDRSNPYNTYANPGYPVGPIGMPGATALDAAIHPADGSWMYFTVVNLKTGETVFSTTLAEHEKAVAQLDAWCKESDENRAYCT